MSEVAILQLRAAQVTRLLANAYGTPDLGNKENPLDELVFIVLSQMTTGPSYSRVFDRLKESVRSWDHMVAMPVRQLRRIIKDAGLSGQKGPRLKSIVKRVVADFGQATLDPLAGWTDADVEAYLTSLPGVGTKTAKCVMMYSLGRNVLPVDTHVYRVATRLGLLSSKTPTCRVHPELEHVVRPTFRYRFHVNAVVHGRTVCKHLKPRCHECPLAGLCPSSRGSASQSSGRRIQKSAG